MNSLPGSVETSVYVFWISSRRTSTSIGRAVVIGVSSGKPGVCLTSSRQQRECLGGQAEVQDGRADASDDQHRSQHQRGGSRASDDQAGECKEEHAPELERVS